MNDSFVNRKQESSQLANDKGDAPIAGQKEAGRQSPSDVVRWDSFDVFKSDIDALIAEGGYGIQGRFDQEYTPSCPCFRARFEIGKDSYEVHGCCWRVSELDEWQDLELSGTGNLEPVGALIKECLDKQEWYSPYRLLLTDTSQDKK